MKPLILLFEDETPIAENLMYALRTDGFDCLHATTAKEGLSLLRSRGPALVVLDVGLPDKSGFEVCREIRAESPVPIFFLTARGDEVDRILGLELGADDYVTKPFSPREVSARVRALFRRMERAPAAGRKAKHPDFEVDDERFQIRFRGEPLDLRRYEFGILKLLAENPGRVYSRAQIMEKVWETPEMSLERTVDTHIKTIRAKLSAISGREMIETHRGVGYSLAERSA